MRKSSALLLTILWATSALAQSSAPPAGGTPPASPPVSAPSQSSIGSSGETGLADNSSLNPPMIGDLGRRGYRLVSQTTFVPMTTTIMVPVTTFVPVTTRTVTQDFNNPSGVPVTTITITTNNVPVTTQQSQQVTTQVAQKTFFRLPLVAPSLKIAENESPRPLDRAYIGYNFYDHLAGIGAPGLDVHRETIGFESTFLDGNASIGVRVPVFQQGGGPAGDFDGFGAASAILKFAFVNDPQTGNLLSGGLQVTVPTGRRTFLDDGDSLNSVYFQPWVGGIYNIGNAFVHGFSSIVLPTDSRDVAFLSNDIGLSYRLYQGAGFLSSFTPTVEAHLFTPITNRGSSELIQAFDDAVITTGAIVGFASNRVLLTTAVAFSVVGPKQFDAEWIAQLNWRY